MNSSPTEPKSTAIQSVMASIDEIWVVDFGDPYPSEPALCRPAVVVGPPERFGPVFPVVFVVPFTSTDRGLSLHIEVLPSPDNGLQVRSFAQPELLRSVSRQRLIARKGTLDPASSDRVRDVVSILLRL